ncbi:methyltransferase domain-containing protein [Candidatus Omnitrophota bacterium]
MSSKNSTLFAKVRYYLKLSQEFQLYLSKYPNDWTKLQAKFNLSLDEISRDIFQFERENIVKFESKVYKLKKIFEKRYRRYFLYGELPRWTYEKPFGYPGDFKIIDNIYQNHPRTDGFDRLWDNYFLQMSAAKATRERKEDFKKIILDFAKEHKGRNIRIMDLASGPAREIKELLGTSYNNYFVNVFFDCYDFDINAINYARQLLDNVKNVNFFQKNAIRLALKKDIKKEIPLEYDLIYSTGLFDYLDENIAIRLVYNLKKILKKNGMIIISNARDKRCNSAAGLMEWVTEWNLIYRTESEFRKIFLSAGFQCSDIKIIPQECQVMQYCFAGR